jgi:lipid-A-disaccharide synthase
MRLLVSALEHSANIHLEYLLRHLEDDIVLEGIFSSDLGEPLTDLRSGAIMGLKDALKKILFFRHLGEEMVKLASDVDAVLLMDSSGFNLPLAKKIKKIYPRKRIIYYILPQAWAWRRSRIPKLVEYTDRLCSILPFEADYYPEEAPIEYVGHPLLDEIEDYRDHPVEEVRKILFMPGSRRREIEALMPYYREVRRALGDREATIAVPPFFEDASLEEIYGPLDGFEVVRDAREALLEADFAFICSGTATLEAALIGTPFVLSYIAGKLDYYIVKNILKIDRIGLANIFAPHFGCGDDIHPELVQDRVNASTLLEEYEKMDRKAFFENSLRLREYLGRGSARRVAEIVREECHGVIGS